ncbi:uncharacterized protein pcare1 isoform X3 [Acanthopagrus latus]|uniref:uncharacterized protein pcare1 isoform X3 n=1 Tax=Acanthopagrus latus TaxID=8177 RepID=UPI00187CC624|nr:uncharacterized protein pcare1 isoform X3 [Acanthopagrus latus]
MFLDSPTQTLDVSFRVRHEESFYMVYASSGSMKCFECGDVGRKRIAGPQRRDGTQRADSGERSGERSGEAALTVSAAAAAGSARGPSAADAKPSVSRDVAGWMTNQPGMMNCGVANQTSELHHALRHTRTCVLLDRLCTETKGANGGPVGLWIRRPYHGFNTVMFIPLGRKVELILLTLPQ